jgi:hypothetical protein
MTILGTWDVTIKTPIGTLAVEYVFTSDGDGVSGSATLKGDTVPLTGIAIDGDRVTWRQSISRPMRLNLEFDVAVDGDRLAGQSRAGRLPRSAVAGVRRLTG